jgi:hypothetical protein
MRRVWTFFYGSFMNRNLLAGSGACRRLSWAFCSGDLLHRMGDGAYTRAVRMLSQFYDKSPDEVTEKELEDYFLHRRNVDHWAPNTSSAVAKALTTRS